jgi:uncharacterized metal-binding protein YceD (DUF177 family)
MAALLPWLCVPFIRITQSRHPVQETKVTQMKQSHILRVADLPQNQPTSFVYTPEGKVLESIATDLDLKTLRKARLTGDIRSYGKQDWHLTAQVGATVVQPCVVSLEPVTSRIDATVERLFRHDFEASQDEETEMHEDDSVEAIPAEIDLVELFVEALALNLPLYPRKDSIELGEAVFTDSGKKPMTDEDTKPFAGLATLKDQLGQDKSE